jgi:arsenate reductase (thioredoxin)
MPLHLFFLCTGNACRSQMAEGFARRYGGDRVRVASAGIEAHGLHPLAVATMAELGIDISAQTSKVVTDDMLAAADLVITVCGHADEHCPVIPAHTRRLHWPLRDPARASGTADEIAAEFRAVRDEIGRRVQALLAQELAKDQER